MRRFAYPFEVTSLLCCRLCEETIFAVLLVVAAGSLACVSDVCVCAFTVLSSSFSFVCLSCYRWSCFLWEGGSSVFLCTTRDNKIIIIMSNTQY
jgi:hypothetical protein